MLYEFCATYGVAYAKPGKLIVATSRAEKAKLDVIVAAGLANSVEGFIRLDGPDAKALEPQLSCVAAVWSPQTGIVDAHGLMLALKGQIEDFGGTVALASPVARVKRAPQGWLADFGEAGGVHPFDAIVTAAGLAATSIARAIEGVAEESIPSLRLAKGHYFAFEGPRAFHPPDLSGSGRWRVRDPFDARSCRTHAV